MLFSLNSIVILFASSFSLSDAIFGLKFRKDAIYSNSTQQLDTTRENRFAKTWNLIKNVYTVKHPSAKDSKIDEKTIPYDPETKMTAVRYFLYL